MQQGIGAEFGMVHVVRCIPGTLHTARALGLPGSPLLLFLTLPAAD